jgi:hypothetical protein
MRHMAETLTTSSSPVHATWSRWRIAALVAGDAISFLVSPWVGAYRRAATTGLRRMLARTELAWLASYPVALILRFVFAPDPSLTPTQIISFALVILFANALFLGVWRAAFALVEGLVAVRRAS